MTVNRSSNVTPWILDRFRKHYQPGRARRAHQITTDAIFHYVYGVLHDPAYREKYARNLKRELPRIPLYGTGEGDFWRWADWGEALMNLHLDYEHAQPFFLKRVDRPNKTARDAGLKPKAVLKSNKESGEIIIDDETTLMGVPAEAWKYILGSRCALDWVLDQYKEGKSKDATIRKQFDTYRFSNYKEEALDLLARVTTISVQTVKITEEMKKTRN